jgi:hypothetical protein
MTAGCGIGGEMGAGARTGMIATWTLTEVVVRKNHMIPPPGTLNVC